MRNPLLLATCLLHTAAEIEFPEEFPHDIQSTLKAYVPRDARVSLEFTSSSANSEGFNVSCESSVTRVQASGLRGLLYGFYTVLRHVGYGFVHPTRVVVPKKPGVWCLNFSDAPSNAGRHGTPLLGAVRGSHYHTQHPLEMTNLLNGFASDGSYDSDSAWAEGLPVWTQYLQWLVANRQNFVEWCLLEAKPWEKFSMSRARKSRLQRLVKMAHDWGMRVSIDAPLNLAQQHAWRLQPTSNSNVNRRLDWLVDVGVDVISTEMGTTEFSSTSPNETVRLINSVVQRLAKHGKELIVKNHASTAQQAKGVRDPLNGKKYINFNYLTYYADKRVVNAPHTVQMYALRDPVMGSYGRKNYSDIEAMMHLFQKDNHPSIFFPETAYWVDFDSSVPLFLPVYAANRLADLKLLRTHMPDTGHLNFESGWPIGYWLSNTAQAVAAWSFGQGFDFHDLISHILAPLPESDELTSIVTTLAELQNQTLVYDIFKGQDGKDQTLMAYVQGSEGMNELQSSWNVAVVMPKRTEPREVKSSWFNQTLHPRLANLENSTRVLAGRCKAVRSGLSAEGAGEQLAKDLCVGVELFNLRVQQITGVYIAAAAKGDRRKKAVPAALERSRHALVTASALIASLQLDGTVTQWTGVASPTAYPFGYLWPAANLFFWRRDHQIVEHEITKPCYLNLYDPIEVGLAEGGRPLWKNLASLGERGAEWMPWLNEWADCMSGPSAQPPRLDPLRGEIVMIG